MSDATILLKDANPVRECQALKVHTSGASLRESWVTGKLHSHRVVYEIQTPPETATQNRAIVYYFSV